MGERDIVENMAREDLEQRALDFAYDWRNEKEHSDELAKERDGLEKEMSKKRDQVIAYMGAIDTIKAAAWNEQQALRTQLAEALDANTILREARLTAEEDTCRRMIAWLDDPNPQAFTAGEMRNLPDQLRRFSERLLLILAEDMGYAPPIEDLITWKAAEEIERLRQEISVLQKCKDRRQ